MKQTYSVIWIRNVVNCSELMSVTTKNYFKNVYWFVSGNVKNCSKDVS